MDRKNGARRITWSHQGWLPSGIVARSCCGPPDTDPLSIRAHFLPSEKKSKDKKGKKKGKKTSAKDPDSQIKKKKKKVD